METPVDVGSPPKSASDGPARSHEQSFSATMEVGGQISAPQSESAVVLDTGAAANLVCYNWLDNHNLFLGLQGLVKAVPYPSNARFEFGDGRIGEVKHVADIKVGIAGCKGASTAFVLGAEIPALLGKGASEALGAQLGFEEDTLSLLRRGVRVPPRVNAMGHYIISVVEFGRGLNVAAPYFEWSVAGDDLICLMEVCICH